MQQISGERLQDHWSSGFLGWPFTDRTPLLVQSLVFFLGQACAGAQNRQSGLITKYHKEKMILLQNGVYKI